MNVHGIDPLLLRRACQRFDERFGAAGRRVAAAPGRVNLIGEHTDYNRRLRPAGGDRHCETWMVFLAAPTTASLRVYSVDFDEEHAAFRARRRSTPGRCAAAGPTYVAGVRLGLRCRGRRDARRWPCVVDGDDADRGGAVVVCRPRAGHGAGAQPRTCRRALPTQWAWLCSAQQCGERLRRRQLRDDGPVRLGGLRRAGAALLLDCRSLETQPVPVPARAAVVVMDTGARRRLAGSAYNDRRAACERVVAAICAGRCRDVRALRDVERASQLRGGRASLDPTDFQRASHVVPENRAARRSWRRRFAEDDLALAGRLMNDSHAQPARPLRGLLRGAGPDHRDRPPAAVGATARA